MAKRILVTGGAGFIGSHLVDLLVDGGNEVVILDNLTTGRSEFVNPRAEFIEGDVREEAALTPIFERGVDAICHIAGQASIRLSYMDPAADLNVNTLGTIHILKHCYQYKVSRLLFASSMTIYGNPEQVPTPETAPPDPVSFYGVTKYAAERYVHLGAARKDIDFPLNVTSFRMFNVYGVRQSLTNAYQGVFAIFIGNVLRGETINIHSDGAQSRDFVHVSDVARAWADAIDMLSTYGQVINLGSGRDTSVNQLCDLVLMNFGKTRADHAIQYHPAQPGDIRRSAADVTKANTLMNWQPRVAWEQGMTETIAWAREVTSGAKR